MDMTRASIILNLQKPNLNITNSNALHAMFILMFGGVVSES